jgi:hypothetical protein
MRSANKGLKDKQSRQRSPRSISYVLTSLQTWCIALDVAQQNSHIIYVLIATPALIGRGSPNRKTMGRHPWQKYLRDRLAALGDKLGLFSSACRLLHLDSRARGMQSSFTIT